MSPSKRQPSKQKRANQNRAQRNARQQRAAAASSAPRSTVASGRGGSGGGLFGRLRGPAAMSATGGAGGGGAMRAGSRRSLADQPVGYRPALVGLLAAGASLLLCLLAIRVPVDREGDLYTPERLAAEWTSSALEVSVADPELDGAAVAAEVETWTPDRHRDLIAKAIWPLSITLALPLIGAYFGFRAVANRRSGRIVNRAMFATLLGAFLTQGLFLLFLPSVIGLGIASFQIRKAELAALAEATADDPGQVDAPGDVIDAEVVEQDDGGAEPTQP